MRMNLTAAAESATLSVSGLALLASAGIAAHLAVQHMQSAAVVCGGGPVGHCVWCVSSAVLTAAGLAALAYGRHITSESLLAQG